MELLDFEGVGARLGLKPPSVRIRHYRAVRRREEGREQPTDLAAPDFPQVHVLPVWKASTIDRWIDGMPGAVGDRYRARRTGAQNG